MKKRMAAVAAGLILLCGCTGGDSEILPQQTMGSTVDSEELVSTAHSTVETEEPEPSAETTPLPETEAAAAHDVAVSQQTTGSTADSEGSVSTDHSTVEIEDPEPSAETAPIPETTAATAQTVITPQTERPDSPAAMEFDRLIDQTARNCGAVGLTTAVFDRRGIVHTYSTGYADTAYGIPCDDATLYRVASVSKFVSALGLMTLYDKGMLDPDSELVSLTGLPFNSSGETPIKLWHLLTHTAGYYDNGAYYSAVYYKYGMSGGAYTSLVNLLPASHGGEPGRQYAYTNFGMGCVGAIIEKVSGEYFCEYIYDNLFAPMGLNAGFAIDQISDRSKVANIYKGRELSYEPGTSFRDCAYYRSYGLGESYFTANNELLISCPDLARIGMMISSGGSYNGTQILSQEAADLINSVWFRTGGAFDMGLSVRIYDGTIVSGRTIYGHPGQALGNVCGLYYDPSDGTGIAVCTNGCSSSTAGNGVYTILNDSVKAAYSCWFDSGE